MSFPVSLSSALPPSRLAGYAVARTLAEGATFLVNGDGGRLTVLKQLDPDCLLRGHLHPAIKERLARVRELAHTGIANLHGVEREGEAAWLVWEYVPGESFDQFASTSACSTRDLTTLARELVLGVEGLHALGLIHGAIHGRNVIVVRPGVIRLTHISPLLYNDPAEDATAVVRLLSDVIEHRGETTSPLGALLAERAADQWTLRALAARLAVMIDVRGQSAQAVEVAEPAPGVRKKTLALASGIAGAALMLAGGTWLYFHETAVKPPTPPNASPAAFDAPDIPAPAPSTNPAFAPRSAP